MAARDPPQEGNQQQRIAQQLAGLNLDAAQNEGVLEIINRQIDRANLLQERVNAGPPRANGNNGHNREREQREFAKIAPRYQLHAIPWMIFYKNFTYAAMSSQGLDDDFKKIVLYQCLQTEATRLAGTRMFPDNEENRNLTLDQYADKLQEFLNQ